MPNLPPLELALDDLTFDEEVELVMDTAGVTDEAEAEFIVALRRGEVTGDLEELRP